ncbi:MAG: oxygen-independent coproporphyrinogen III oxidase [Paludibacter sp.]|nr:oxygen-independent coproporphyrinogen III oxidase [Paludibacter sp.]
MKVTPEFLNKYNKAVPRYTSYPPATSFSPCFTSKDFIPALIASNDEHPENISIYVHIPFCPQLCHFCGCNTTTFESAAKIRRYIDCVLKEIDTVAEHIDKSRKVTQIHWGGGTPNSINFDYIEEIIEKIKLHFQWSDNPEIAIECSPAYLSMEDIDRLAAIGFNRVSMGIQDFNPEVLKAINRRGPKFPIEQVMERLRKNNFKGINLDLVYGLPLQTLESFKQNIEKVIALSPDRIVTFSYAQVPWVNSNQKKMDETRMAGPEEKLQMLLAGYEIMTHSGYEAIGMDHFAKPTDDLAIAKHSRKLHRNFQGYCTRETTGQVYAFGTSGISQLWGTYAQNLKNLHQYIDAIEATGLAIDRGYSLTKEEIVIREVINELMCNGYLNFEDIAKPLQCTANEIISITNYNPAKLEPFIEDGLVKIVNNNIHVSEDGMFVVRNIAMLFDPNLTSNTSQFSKAV